MPLARPVSASPTSNFGELTIAISFALAKLGETVDDFQSRIGSPGRDGSDKLWEGQGSSWCRPRRA